MRDSAIAVVCRTKTAHIYWDHRLNQLRTESSRKLPMGQDERRSIEPVIEKDSDLTFPQSFITIFFPPSPMQNGVPQITAGRCDLNQDFDTLSCARSVAQGSATELARSRQGVRCFVVTDALKRGMDPVHVVSRPPGVIDIITGLTGKL